MSKLVVEVCEVLAVDRHPNADRLAIATVKGWKTCIRFDPETNQPEFQPGDKCIYIPPNAILPARLANAPDDPIAPGRLGVKNYLKSLPEEETGDGTLAGRVAATRLRGVSSYGLIVRLNPDFGDDPDWPIGTDLSDHFGIVKYEPPPEIAEGDSLPPHHLFHSYSSIENYGNFPALFRTGEAVIFTEKIHGKNCRLGLALDTDEKGHEVWAWMAGSHGQRRQEFDKKKRRSEFWEVLTEPVRALLEFVRDEPWTVLFGGEEERKFSVLLFGEIFGSGVQDMQYGFKSNQRSFRAFDLAVNGRYLDFDTKVALFERFGIERVPILYRGPFSMSALEEYTSGDTTLCAPGDAGKFSGREGVVITPVEERLCPLINGRLILKSISADYLARRGGTEFH